MFNFVKYQKIYFIFSAVLILSCLFFLVFWGLKPGIDFTGGSILDIEYKGDRPENKIIIENLADLDLGEVSVQPADQKGVILRMKDVPEETHQKILENLKATGDFEEKSFESIGPVIGRELKEKTNIVVILSFLSIVIYIIIAFRRVSHPVSSWQYGVASLFMLFHDILIPLGVFAILGKFYQVQITIPVVTAFLTIAGYAINNVIVVYDRIRENILRVGRLDFAETANKAINQTLTRQFNTSFATLLPLITIFFFGGETLKYFALALIIGLAAGLYSSIFLASPMLVAWVRRKEKRKV